MLKSVKSNAIVKAIFLSTISVSMLANPAWSKPEAKKVPKKAAVKSTAPAANSSISEAPAAESAAAASVASTAPQNRINLLLLVTASSLNSSATLTNPSRTVETSTSLGGIAKPGLGLSYTRMLTNMFAIEPGIRFLNRAFKDDTRDISYYSKWMTFDLVGRFAPIRYFNLGAGLSVSKASGKVERVDNKTSTSTEVDYSTYGLNSSDFGFIMGAQGLLPLMGSLSLVGGIDYRMTLNNMAEVSHRDLGGGNTLDTSARFRDLQFSIGASMEF